MWKQKLGLGLSDSFGLGVAEQIRKIAAAGYDAFFTDDQSGMQAAADTAEIAKIGRESGLIYQSVHAPFLKSADMWHGDKSQGAAAVKDLTDCIARCAKAEVPIMIVHTFIGFDDGRCPNDRGIERYGEAVRAAEHAGVKIAFENTEGEEYLFALMEAFKNEKSVGFCWDSGHEMCYNHSADLLDRFGDRLIATHINDNLGIKDFAGKTTFLDDLHLLPFDGIADWDYNAARLKKCGCPDVLTFELTRASKPDRHENDIYSKMSIDEYLTESFKRACKVAAKITK